MAKKSKKVEVAQAGYSAIEAKIAKLEAKIALLKSKK